MDNWNTKQMMLFINFHFFPRYTDNGKLMCTNNFWHWLKYFHLFFFAKLFLYLIAYLSDYFVIKICAKFLKAKSGHTTKRNCLCQLIVFLTFWFYVQSRKRKHLSQKSLRKLIVMHSWTTAWDNVSVMTIL